MCLILQETRFQVQMLLPCKSVQELSQKVLYIKVWQLAFIEVYEIQFFRTVFHPICEFMFRFSFLTTLNIYKDYVKGRLGLRECEAKFCSCKLWLETKFSLVHLSLEKATVFVHRRVLWPRSFVIFIVLMNWRTLQPTSFSSWWLVTYLDLCIELVSHVLEVVHWKWEVVTIEQVQLGIGVRVQL